MVHGMLMELMHHIMTLLAPLVRVHHGCRYILFSSPAACAVRRFLMCMPQLMALRQ